MNEFQTYFTLGYQHILDWNGYDHMIFLIALIAPISLKEWKKAVFLVTCFTIGHSISLALSTLDLVVVDSGFIELLIPITILITALSSVFIKKPIFKVHYNTTVLFGVIHGLGFSGYLKSLLGNEENLIAPLLSFNLGLEFGQIIFTGILLIIVLISRKYLSVQDRTINLLLSGLSIIISLFLIFERI